MKDKKQYGTKEKETEQECFKMRVNYTTSKLCQGHISSPLEMGFSISAEILEMKDYNL